MHERSNRAERRVVHLEGGDVSRPSRIIVVLILVATVVLEVVATFAYRDSSDGQSGALNVILLLYGVLACVAVWVLDRAARSIAARRHRRG
jgi:hypothetical protein